MGLGVFYVGSLVVIVFHIGLLAGLYSRLSHKLGCIQCWVIGCECIPCWVISCGVFHVG